MMTKESQVKVCLLALSRALTAQSTWADWVCTVAMEMQMFKRVSSPHQTANTQSVLQLKAQEQTRAGGPWVGIVLSGRERTAELNTDDVRSSGFKLELRVILFIISLLISSSNIPLNCLHGSRFYISDQTFCVLINIHISSAAQQSSVLPVLFVPSLYADDTQLCLYEAGRQPKPSAIKQWMCQQTTL